MLVLKNYPLSLPAASSVFFSKKIVSGLIVSFFLYSTFGCESAHQATTRDSRPFTDLQMFKAVPDKAYLASVRALQEEGFRLEMSDKQSGLLTATYESAELIEEDIQAQQEAITEKESDDEDVLTAILIILGIVIIIGAIIVAVNDSKSSKKDSSKKEAAKDESSKTSSSRRSAGRTRAGATQTYSSPVQSSSEKKNYSGGAINTSETSSRQASSSSASSSSSSSWLNVFRLGINSTSTFETEPASLGVISYRYVVSLRVEPNSSDSLTTSVRLLTQRLIIQNGSVIETLDISNKYLNYNIFNGIQKQLLVQD
jgi:hypothetical protein